MAPNLGLNRAAAMPIPQITLPSVKTRPAVANAVMKHAGDVKKTAGGDRMRRAEVVGDVAEKRRERAHQQHRQRVG